MIDEWNTQKSDVISVIFSSNFLSRLAEIIAYVFLPIKTSTILRSTFFLPRFCVLLELTISRGKETLRHRKDFNWISKNREINVKSGLKFVASTAKETEAKFAAFDKAGSFTRDLLRIKSLEMSLNDIKIPRSTLAELRGVLVRALSRENLSECDKMAIRKSQSSSALKIHYTWNSSYGGKKSSRERLS